MRKPFCLLFLFLVLPIQAQQSSVLPTMESLSNPMVSSLAEDVSGDIWIGTGRGLNRYNGSAYTVWLQETCGLRDDNIRVLAAEADGSLWVGTRSGLGVLREGKVDPSWTVDARNVFSIVSWDSGHLLYSAAGGLFLTDKQTAAVEPVFLDPRLQYFRFTLLPDRRIWLRNLSSSAFTVLDPDFRILREFSLPERTVNGLTVDTDGTVWLSTSRGMLHFASDGTPSPAKLPGALATGTDGRNVLFLAIRDGDRFVGISDAGIFRVEADGSLRQEWEYETLSGAQSCSYLLTRDNLWLSKDGRGLTNLYRHTDEHSLKLPSRYPSDALNMFYGIGDGQLLVITNKGIFRQRIATGESVQFTGPGLNGNCQLGITLRDRRGGLWVQYDYDELRHYVFEADDRLRLDASWPIEPTNCIWDDPSGNVLLLQEGSILRFGPSASLPVREPSSGHPEFWFCGQFASGKPYFLAYDDVWLLDADGTFVAADTGIPGPDCVWEDGDGCWWVGTRRDGIWHYDPRSGSARQIDLKAQDVDRSISSIIGDRNGNVWAAARFDFIRVSDGGEDIRIFKNPDPFGSANNTNSAVVTDNGTVLFGSRERLSFIMQGGSRLNPEIPIFLDGITVNGRMIPYDHSGVLELDHRSRQLSFFFSGRNFNPGVHPIYQFRLDGYDPDWVYAGQTLRAGYSRLKSGRYTFRARVQQLDGIWGADELVVPVRIKPSPMLSWVAILIYSLLGFALVGFVLQQIIRNRTNRERLELSEQEKNLLEQISQERMTFYTDVSHEFRTPLSLIYGPVKELSQSPNLSDGDRKLIGIIDRNSERMIRLTDQFLHFNRSRSSRDGLSVQRTDLTVLLQQMLRNFEYMFAQKNLRVTGDLPRELIVFCDREKVERIIFNLLSNAVKYTPEHGAITLRAGQDGSQAYIEVADTGIGIAPDKAEQIFGRFERLGERVGGDLPTGFGIGLNYARHLALVHKGDLSVRANDPIGSVFRFVFPWQLESYAEEAVWHDEKKEQEQEAQPEPADLENGSEELPRILVVEDNADMRDYIHGFLSGEGRIMLAGDGEQAWKSIRISAPDLIVSDVMMPYKDGYTLCKEIKNDPEYCHIPIILLTAKADMENQLHGLDLGADGYVGKPFDPAYLSALIRNLLANRRRLQALLADRTSGSPEPDERPEGLSASDKAFLDKCYRIVDEHLSEEEFGVTALSLEIGMSRTSVFSKLKALTGQSPNTFMTNYRLNRAMELLKTREYNVSEVGYKVGFGTLTGFSRSFKNKFGVPPSAV